MGERPASGFPRSARLRRPAEFRAALAGGQRHRSRYWNVVAAAQTATRARLGLAMPSRVAPRAVDRNRFKRLAREVFRHHRDRLPPLAFVVSCRPEALDAPRGDLRRDLDALWTRLE